MNNNDPFGTREFTRNLERQNKAMARSINSPLMPQRKIVERDGRRSFNKSEQNHLREIQRGRCARCRKFLVSAVHYDHIKPYEEGGKTDISNGQALCPTCHSLKTNEDRLKKQKKKRVV